MAAARIWTLEEVHAIPDERNRYELLFGELFVTPAPGLSHEVSRGGSIAC